MLRLLLQIRDPQPIERRLLLIGERGRRLWMNSIESQTRDGRLSSKKLKRTERDLTERYAVSQKSKQEARSKTGG